MQWSISRIVDGWFVSVLKVDRKKTESAIVRLFMAYGVSAEEANLVTADLFRAESMGVSSHGIIRVPEYLEDITRGRVRLCSPIRVVGGSGGTAIVDCGSNLGIVAANRVLDIAVDLAARTKVAAVVTRNCNHIGRLSTYAERAARAGFACVAMVSIPRFAHSVVPWGGREGRLGTNPIAFSFPTDGDPIIADFSTAVIPEGKVRSALLDERPLLPGAVLDAEGVMTTDPTKFYGPPRGALLPFGGPVGYKGYALGMFAQLFSAPLAGIPVDADDAPVNSFFLLLVDVDSLLPAEEARSLAQGVAEYMKSSPLAPGHPRVLVPGEWEFEESQRSDASEEIETSGLLWDTLTKLARYRGIDLSDAVVKSNSVIPA